MYTRWSIVLANAIATATLFAADELPTDPEQPLEIEPPLLIGNRARIGSLIVPKLRLGKCRPTLNLAKLEADLARAKKSAASGERLYRGGIIAKVEAEDRALKVVRLEAKLAEAQLQETKRQVEAEKSSDESADAKPDVVAQAEAAAARAVEQRQQAEFEAALRNLQRQQKLLALGSGRKADVNRAQQKLVELQRVRRTDSLAIASASTEMRRAFLLLMLTCSVIESCELKTVDERLVEFGEIVRQRLAPAIRAGRCPPSAAARHAHRIQARTTAGSLRGERGG